MTQKNNPNFSDWKESGYGIHAYHSHLENSGENRKQLIATYYGMMSLIDKYIGKILNKLDELGLAENTIVVFKSDHGHFFGQHGLQHKGVFHYDDLIKAPFITRYPSHIPAGEISHAIQSLVDLAPTFLSFTDIPFPLGMTGINQRDTWLAKEKRKQEIMLFVNSDMNKLPFTKELS